MTDATGHGAAVDEWLRRAVAGRPTEQQLAALEAALAALWQRAHRTLGEVTLAAIVDRVLHVSAQRHPSLGVPSVDSRGVRLDDLRARAGELDPGWLAQAIRFVLVELLTVLDNLTAGILTGPLHAELARAGPARDARDDRQQDTTGPKDGAT